MKDTLENAVKTLAEKAAKTPTGDEANRFSQAALNLAQIMSIFRMMETNRL